MSCVFFGLETICGALFAVANDVVDPKELKVSKEVRGLFTGDLGRPTLAFCSFRGPSFVGDLVGERGETCAEFLLTPGRRYLSGTERNVRGACGPPRITSPA